MEITKAVILAAGLGSRMLPMTKAIPKPMLPVVDKPILEYIVEEAFSSGIKDIVMIVNHQKEVIEKHFEDYENIYYIHQKELKGTADALLQAKIFVQNEPFVLYYADEIIKSEVPCTKQLIQAFSKVDADVITAIEIEESDMISQYNSLVIGDMTNQNTYEIKEIIEKPTNPPTRYTSIGRFIVNSSIYPELENVKHTMTSDKELYLTDAFASLAKKGRMYGHIYEGKRYDIGSKKGWLQANIELSNI